MTTIVVAAPTVAGALSAAIVVARTQAMTTERESTRRMRALAMTSCLAAVNSDIGELSALAVVPLKKPGWLCRRMAKRGAEVVLYLYPRAVERMVFGARLREQVGHLAEAHAQLVVCDASEELIKVMDEVNCFISGWLQDAATDKRQWPQLSHRLCLAVAQEAMR
jgi:hypothetical protein